MAEYYNQHETDKCTELFRAGVSNLHAGLLEIQRGAAQIVEDKMVFGKPQIEKGMALTGLGVCNIEKATMLGCVSDTEKLYRLNRGLTEIKTGIAGINIGLDVIPEFWSDNSNHWRGCIFEILSGMVKVGNGHNIVLDVWGDNEY
jgi:hypothetical protein